MGLFSGIGHFLGDLFGGGDQTDEEKKRQQLQRYQAPQKTVTFGAPVRPQDATDPFTPIIKPPDNGVTLAQSPLQKANNVTGGLPTFDPNTLMKAKPAFTPQPEQPPKPPDTRSFWQKATHNPVTNFVGDLAKVPVRFSENYSNTFANLGNRAAGGKNKTIQENMGGNAVLDKTLALSGATGKNAQLAGDAVTIGLTAAAPGIENVIEKGVTRTAATLAPKTAGAIINGVRLGLPYDVAAEATGKAFPALVKYGTAGLTGGTLNTAFGATNEAVAGHNPGEILKKVPENFALGAGIGVATPLVVGGLKKAATADAGIDEGVALSAANSADNEIAPGVKSTNPNRIPDAVKQVAERTPPEPTPPTPVQAAATDVNTPAYQRTNLKAQAAAEREAAIAAKEAELGGPPNNLDKPTYQHNADIQAVIDRGQAELDDFVNTHQGATTQELEAAQTSIRNQVVEQVQKLQEARAGGTVSPAVAPEPVTPVAPPVEPVPVASRAPAPVDTATPVVPEPVAAPIDTVPTAPVEPVAPTPIVLPDQVAALEPAGAATADVAPMTHDAIAKQLGDIGQELKGKYGKRVPLDLQDLKTNAQGAIANMTDEDLLKAFATADPANMVNSPQEFGLARAAIERLSKVEGNAQADQTVKNILDGMAAYESKSGQGLRVVQEEFDSMPLAMKTRYIIKNIDNANKGVEGYARLADDPAKAAMVEGNITGFLKGSEAINERVAALQGQLNAVADQAKAGIKSDVNIADITKQLRNEQRALAANNGELVKYYQKMLPKRSVGQRTNDLARNMMLSSFTGRINDVLTTSSSMLNQGVQNVTQGLLAKAINLVKPGTVTDTLRGVPEFFRGTREGVKTGVGEFRGDQYAGDLQKALSDNTGARTGMQKARGPIGRTVQAATEFATNLSEGVKTQRVYQLAVKEGQQAGLKGDLLDQYAQARAAVPTRQMLSDAEALKAQVNNLNDNPVSRALNRVSAGIASDQPGVAGTISGVIKNQIMPFTSWLGGNIYNTFTDKNVVASAIKAIASAGKGDMEGLTANLAKTANNAAYAYGLGYLLTKAGVITNQGPTDPNTGKAYNDAGAYLHVGGRYIPVGFLGFVAPNIILGNAAYNGLQNHQGDVGAAIGDAASNSLLNWARSVNAAGALGVNNNISRTISDINTPGSKVTGGDILAQTAGNVGGQFIPALTSDINAVINNGIKIGGKTIVPDSANPTHEAAQTTVKKLNPATGNEIKDPTASAAASFMNRIPGVSQTLPRKEGVAAPDVVDKVTKGTRDTGAGVQVQNTAKGKVNQTKDFKARNIPDPNASNFDDAVKARTEDGNYDAAIEGLNAKLKMNEKDSNIPKSTNKKIETQIKQLEVTKKGGFTPAMIELYQKTSLSEWRDMGDPLSDAYDPTTYANLYRYDSALADAGVSRNNTKADNTFYSPKKPGKGRKGNSPEDIALAKIKSNTVGSTPNLGKISFGTLAPEKITNAKIPTIQQIKAGDLIKQRKISVGKAF